MATAKKTTPAAVEAVKKPARSKAVAAPQPDAKSADVVKKPATKKVATKASTATAASKPVTKTAPKAASKTASKPAAAKKAAAVAKKLDAAQRANYVEVAAFYIAERRGFAAANPMDDWLAAEAEIDRLIASGHFGG